MAYPLVCPGEPGSSYWTARYLLCGTHTASSVLFIGCVHCVPDAGVAADRGGMTQAPNARIIGTPSKFFQGRNAHSVILRTGPRLFSTARPLVRTARRTCPTVARRKKHWRFPSRSGLRRRDHQKLPATQLGRDAPILRNMFLSAGVNLRLTRPK